MRSTEVGDEPVPSLEHGEAGIRGGHPQVAGQGELEPRTQGVPLHRGDRGLGHAGQHGERPLRQPDERTKFVALDPGKLGEGGKVDPDDCHGRHNGQGQQKTTAAERHDPRRDPLKQRQRRPS